MPLTCTDVDFDLKIAEFNINGYTISEDMIPAETVDKIHAAFLPLLADVQARETEIHKRCEQGDIQIVHPQSIDNAPCP